MSGNPKFMVIHLKELLYTLVFILLGIILIVSLILMFRQNHQTKKEEHTTDGIYNAGVYTSSLTLNGNPMDITVTLDANHINSIKMENVSDAIATMYPLVQPSFEDLANQIVTTQSLDNIQFSEDYQYTYNLLYDEICNLIQSAKNEPN
ncbi:MAG: hypothetical protein K6G85_04225 [Eubacterium sp.]|nr:hypothetical protein [Eubacterium sp.]